MLLFKKKFLEAIRSGEKSQTIRLWGRPRLSSGQRSYIPGVGYIRIQAVDPIALDDLTDADALPDGFPTADALRAEIQSIYSQYPNKGQQAYRIRFVLAPGEIKRPRDESQKIRRNKIAGPEGDSRAEERALRPPTLANPRLPKVPLPAEGYLLQIRSN
jgi:hypothetical protein